MTLNLTDCHSSASCQLLLKMHMVSNELYASLCCITASTIVPISCRCLQASCTKLWTHSLSK